jgi:hypothetical protein
MNQMSADNVADAMTNIVLGQSAEAEPEQPTQSDSVTTHGQGEVNITEPEQSVETLEIDPEAELFEMELDDGGQKVTKKLSLKEFQRGYLRQSDYTRKTMDLARQRAEVQESVRQATQEASKQYLQKLEAYRDALVKTIEPEFANVDLRQLSNEDPFRWATLRQRMDDFNKQLQALDTERAQILERSKQEEQQRKAVEWSKTVEQLQQDIPDWGQPVVQRIVKAAKEAGATESEVNELDKGWVIKALHKAALYDDLQNKRPEVEKKVAVVTKTLKPGQKVTPTRTDERMQQWKKSGGKINADGAALFDKFI